MESLPVLLLVGAILSVMVVGIGTKAVEIFDRKSRELASLQEFQEFAEKARAVCYGAGELQVKVTEAEIIIKGKLIQLRSPPRVESLPVPFYENKILRKGVYVLRLKKTKGGRFLEVK